MLTLEFSGLNSSSQGLKFVWWWGTAPMKELVKKGRDSGMTWTIDYGWSRKWVKIMRAGRPERMDWRYGERRYNWCFLSSRREWKRRRVVEFCTEMGLCVV